MKRRIYILLLTAVVGGLAVAWGLGLRAPEPVYKGRKVSEWIVTMPAKGAAWNLLKAEVQKLRDERQSKRDSFFLKRTLGIVLKTNSPSLPAQNSDKASTMRPRGLIPTKSDPAWTAIRELGTNSLPYLIESLQRQPSWFDPLYKTFWNNCPAAWRSNRLATPRPAIDVRRNAAALLVVLGRKGLPALPAAVRALDDPDADVRLFATYFVEIHGADGAPAIPALLKNLGHGDEMLRMESLEVLDKMHLDADQIAKVMAGWPDFTNTSRWFVPKIREHERFGLVACAMLMRTASTADPALRLQAFSALQAASTNAFSQVPKLVEMLDSPQRGLQLQAMWTLEKIGPAAEAAIPKLERLEKNENALIANTAANTLVYVRRPVK